MKTNEKLRSAVKIIENGGLVIFPTETAFGIGCRMDDPKAVARLFKIRKRPESQPTPVLVGSEAMAQEYLRPLEKKVKALMQAYWPGALTLILPCQTEKILPLVRGGGQTLGVRMPNHEIPLSIIYSIGVPILGPSANFHGAATPYKFTDLDPKLVKLVDLVLPGECSLKAASTVLDCSVKPWKIIRQGAVDIMI